MSDHHLLLSLTSWFHGNISGPEAVSKLQPPEDGLFLVRESVRHPGDYVLCISVSGEVVHYRVIYKDNKLTIDNVEYFYNLIDMIEVREKKDRALLCYLISLYCEYKCMYSGNPALMCIKLGGSSFCERQTPHTQLLFRNHS